MGFGGTGTGGCDLGLVGPGRQGRLLGIPQVVAPIDPFEGPVPEQTLEGLIDPGKEPVRPLGQGDGVIRGGERGTGPAECGSVAQVDRGDRRIGEHGIDPPQFEVPEVVHVLVVHPHLESPLLGGETV